MTGRKTYAELNYFNAAACLFVILIHVLSVGITSLDKTSPQMAVVFLLWKLAAYVVPGFLFTGAVKMALGFEAESRPLTLSGYAKYVWRRILKIYVPYVLWVGVYYLYFLRIGWVESGIDVFLRYVFVGDLSSPFYYVVTVMQFYLLMPLWRWMTKRVPWFAGILTAGLITLAMLYSEGILAHMGVSFAYRDRVFPSYLIFWVLGLYVGKYYGAVREALRRHVGAVLAMLIPVAPYGVGMLVQFAHGIWLFDGNVIKMFTDCMTICIALTLCILLCDRAENTAALRVLTRPLSFIYAASFSVYLSHCLFLQIISSAIAQFAITDIGVQLVLRAAVCYTAPFVLWYGWYWAKKGIHILCRKRKAA